MSYSVFVADSWFLSTFRLIWNKKTKAPDETVDDKTTTKTKDEPINTRVVEPDAKNKTDESPPPPSSTTLPDKVDDSSEKKKNETHEPEVDLTKKPKPGIFKWKKKKKEEEES